MVKNSSFHHHFHLESRPNKDGKRLLFLNFSYGYNEFNPLTGKTRYKYLRLSTQKRVHPDNWDEEKKDLKKNFSNNQGSTIKNRMNLCVKVATAEVESFEKNHKRKPKPEELQKLVKETLGFSTPEVTVVTLVDSIDSFIEENQKLTRTNKGRLGEKQIKKYKTVRNNLFQYQSHLGCEILCGDFSKEMFVDYQHYLNDEYKTAGNPHGYMVNTMAKKANTLIAILRKLSKNQDLEFNIDLSDDSLRINEVPSADAEVFISEVDLQKVIDSDTFKLKSFEYARNYIIISSLTSLRYDDMAHLHELEVSEETRRGRTFIGVDTLIRKPSNQSRKDFRTFIPILKPVKKIYDECGGKFPKFPANATMNKHVKEFAKHIGLSSLFNVERNYFLIEQPIKTKEPLHELITCHMGRDSFVSNLSSLGVNHAVIMNISHPEQAKNTMQKVYDKSTMVDRAALFVEELDRLSDKTNIYQV